MQMQSRRRLRRLALAVSALVVPSSLAQEAAQPLKPLDASATVFQNVHVLSPEGDRLLPGRSVLVEGGKIARIEEAGKLQAPEAARVVDGRGEMYLIPGLCDMHVHFAPQPGDKGDAAWRSATLLLANGVTTARGLFGHDSHIELRRRTVEGEILGATPHVAGMPITAQNSGSPEAAAANVKALHDKGFDVVKSHRVIAPAIFEAVQETAKALGIPVTGHVDNEVGLDRGIASGMQMEHLDGWFAAMLTEPDLAATFGQFPVPAVQPSIDVARIPELAARIGKSGQYSTPTHALFSLIADATTTSDDLRGRPEMKYIPRPALEAWTKQRIGMTTGLPFKDAAFSQWFIGTRGSIIRALQENGGRILAGSDSPQAFLVTGFALHDELETLQAAGLTPAQALAAATRNPAAYFATLPNKGSALGIAPDFGVLDQGRRADLVLLRADPLKDTRNTREIEGVMVRGKWLDRAALDQMLAEVEAAANAA